MAELSNFYPYEHHREHREGTRLDTNELRLDAAEMREEAGIYRDEYPTSARAKRLEDAADTIDWLRKKVGQLVKQLRKGGKNG